ncbi:MAG: protein translocase subunit SecF [bacterium]|nr:protein translocase subunit SecF [candidate division WOR-3 bacterium]MDH5682940.1 protein translocase subunit SecF [candidate division WOR-3 bacterium]
MRLLTNVNISFIGLRRYSYTISGILMILSLIIISVKGIKFGVDFTGGTQLQVKFTYPVKTEALRSALSKIGQADASIQSFGGSNEFLIRVEAGSSEDFAKQVLVILDENFPDNPVVGYNEETVGPRIGRELRGKAILAVIVGLILILIYITIRFDFRYGVASIFALFHNVLICLGILVLFSREFTMPILAALLTIIGYAVNDTIVVSDRIREDVRKMHKERYRDVVNQAINKTLSRTIITSSVILVAICLWLLGAPAIQDFAMMLTFGILLGTYASIFIVAQLVAQWEELMPSRRRRA